jgi:eukaryotic-like serine/threonine-protein kinase
MEGTVLLVQKFGKYESWEKIGDGVYGSTYRSRDPLLDRQVAIKSYRSELTASPEFIEHFRREARQLASLRHPNIVTVIDGGEENGQFYLVMEYLPGGSLVQMLRDNKQLSISRVIELLRPVADALDYSHSRRVFHRDLKPSNILFGEDGHPVLTDFAVAKPAPRNGNGKSSMAIVGTPEYLAPEQILTKDANAQTDIYALGVIAFQMLAGRPPFTGSVEGTYRSHLEQPPPDVRIYNPAIPKELSDILARAMAKEPHRRFNTAREFIDTLEQLAIQISREQGRALYQAAKEHMKLLQFDAAIVKLEQVLALRANPEVENLLKECERRKHIVEEIQTLKAQLTNAQARLEVLMTSETWLQTAVQPGQNVSFLQRMAGKR